MNAVLKIKIMIVGGDGNVEPFLVDGTKVEQVTRFNFLAMVMSH